MSSNMDDDDLWDASTQWDTQIEVPARLIEYVDDNVRAHFREGTTIQSIHPHGSSYWSRTAEIQTVVSGEAVSYFLKVSQNKFAKKMFRGEYESQKAIYEVCPDFCPQPITWGVYRHFMMAEKIGQGAASEELKRLEEVFFDRIIPRLCRPLETGGREIEPRLVHSDLWDGNSAIDAQTESPIIYDSSCFYGHNEYDLGVWRCPRHRTGTPYIEKYHEFFARSAPEEDHEGRMLMYFLSFDTRASACWMGRADFRNSMIDIMTELDKKFPETYAEWATARGEPVCTRKGSVVN